MSAGVDAVKAALIEQFNSPEINYDEINLQFSFLADGQQFIVSVTLEFDQDFGNAPRVDLRRLGDILRVRKKATVTSKGISA